MTATDLPDGARSATRRAADLQGAHQASALAAFYRAHGLHQAARLAHQRARVLAHRAGTWTNTDPRTSP